MKATISRVDILKAYLVFILCGWYVNTVDAQSQCVIKNDGESGIVECDVSFTLLKSEARDAGGAIASNAWVPDDAKRLSINERLEQFSKIWCVATGGYSSIDNITVFTNGNGNSDFYLYRATGGRASASSGAFPNAANSVTVYDENSGVVVVHEFVHAALDLADEYQGGIIATGCSPSIFHDTLPTLMGDLSSLRLSYAADYPERGNIQTAQSACFGKSAWEVITQSAYRDDPRSPSLRARYPRQDYLFRLGAAIPDDEQLDAVDDISGPNASEALDAASSCAPSTINWISSTSSIVMMMDHSASMDDNRRLAIAKAAAKGVVDLFYVERSPVELAIVGFDDVPRTEIAPTQLDHIENIRMLKSVINSFVADGGTDYEAALAHVQTVFDNIDSDRPKLLIVISDGETEPSSLDYFKNNNILVYTVELDTEGKVILQDVVTKAMNRFNIEVDTPRLNSFMPRVLRDASVIRNDQLAKSLSFDNRLIDDVVTTTTIISQQSEAASFILRWDEDAVFDSFTLQRADDVMINQVYADAAEADDIRYWEGTSQAIYYVASPMSGIWKMFVTGTGDFEYEVAVSSGIVAGINAGAEIILQETPNDRVVYPEPIPILVKVGGTTPITHADVMAEVTMADDSTMSVRLMDDGNAPDETERDGLYSGMLADYSEDGICEIEVTVSNSEGKAMYDSTRLLYHAPWFGDLPITPAIPTPAPRFERVVYDQVDVMNTKEKFMPPPLSVQATTITVIPYLDKGSIEQAGQVHWYRFNSMREGKRYYIQTSNLMGYDNTPMVTEVSLYEPNSEDLIETSVRYRGSDVSSIEWLAPRENDYLVSVSHAEGGRGYYEFTVSEENLLSEPQIAEAERRSRSGGSVGYPLLLLLLLAMAVSCRRMTYKVGRARIV